MSANLTIHSRPAVTGAQAPYEGCFSAALSAVISTIKSIWSSILGFIQMIFQPLSCFCPSGTTPTSIVPAPTPAALLVRNSYAPVEDEESVDFSSSSSSMDDVERYAEIQRDAENGDAEAQVVLGSMYLTGMGGVTPSYEQSLFWLKRAAELGNSNADCMLAMMGENGRTPQLKIQSMQIVQPSAPGETARLNMRYSIEGLEGLTGLDGMQNFMSQLGGRNQEQMQRGLLQGVETFASRPGGFSSNQQARVQMIRALQERAEANDADAQFVVGCMHLEEVDGVEHSEILAKQWLQRAADQGHAEAKRKLAELLS